MGEIATFLAGGFMDTFEAIKYGAGEPDRPFSRFRHVVAAVPTTDVSEFSSRSELPQRKATIVMR
ncbi:hypothetical protein GWG65_32555 [Bradyrhizobium sp. CSA207]|uniref:hypothetical protein n=1 Tax=Bradyrhizobium sp. CSA207 TaxID=2698826 RepID=UPI0023B206C7|nr:hypothetical protein [Bradyrhizobium sp. CSA207]MDE5446059.1 hypothetical protein [Bradyrhizobium sp. CSA207]